MWTKHLILKRGWSQIKLHGDRWPTSATRWPSESHHLCYEIASRGGAHRIVQNVVTLLHKGRLWFVNDVTPRNPVYDGWFISQHGLLAGRVTDLRPNLLLQICLHVAHQLTCLGGFQARLPYRLYRCSLWDANTQLRSYLIDSIYRWSLQLPQGVQLWVIVCLFTNACSLPYLKQPLFSAVVHLMDLSTLI